MPIQKPRFNWLRQRPGRIVQWMQSHERSASWWTAGFTGLICLITAVYATVAFFQMRAMNKTVEQTQTLIEQQKEALAYAKTQADSAQTAALISRQLLVSYALKLVSFKPNERMLVDVSVVNKSSFPASISGGDVKFVFSESVTATNDFKDTSPLQAVELPVGWEDVSYHIGSRILTQKEVADIKAGRLYAFVFMRVFLKGVTAPLESCHFYSTVTKDLGRCER